MKFKLLTREICLMKTLKNKSLNDKSKKSWLKQILKELRFKVLIKKSVFQKTR